MTEFQPVLLPLVLTAFMTGLLGSGHCFAMCGGIAGSFGVTGYASPGSGQAGRRGPFKDAAWRAAQFNLGRLSGYAIAGALSALLLGSFSRMDDWQWLALLLRGMTGLLVLLMGFRFLFNWRGLDVIERWGAGVWARVAPFATRFISRPGAANRLMLGMCWGFLPCGLVYTLLLTAASTGDVVAGASVMLAFGAGTLPSMLGLTLAAPALATVLKDQDFRRFIGLSMVLLAAWMLISTYSMGGIGSATEGATRHH